MIDVHVQLSVSDRKRRFDLDIAFATDAPFVALYGPSGAGKSLTLQAMAGLLPVREGHVKLNGRALLDTAAGIVLPPEARGVGYLFQHYALFPHLSVRDNVAFGLTSWRKRLDVEDAAHVDELITAFGLTAMAHSKPNTLSGGQQQRVALARALACKPQLLLLDEPFAALHTTLRRQLRTELRELRQRLAIPAIIVSHDPEDVMALADEVFLLDGGAVQRRLKASDPGLRAALEAAP